MFLTSCAKNLLNKINYFLGKEEHTKSIYTDLLPTSDADKDGHYGKALSFALESDEIKNIALTGPYGSGKSSIIKTFERKNDNYNFLNVSLATFEGESKPDDQLIGKSILQQMIYGASGDNLPYSRFRKILKPKWSKLKVLIMLIGLVSLFVVYKKSDLFLSFDFNNGWPSEFDNNIYTLIIATFLSFISSTYILSTVYKSTFKSQFKKISLTNMEVEKGTLDNESLLNKHLDEIIYFFKETHYDLVVIEDLDRFGLPEIFIKLREINKLINDSFSLKKCWNKKKKVQFLYALKDDMFLHKDRTKFFDFIIPVLPVINTSNSLDQIREILKNTPYEEYFAQAEPKDFLREVSFFLDDLRLIKNIFNEFNVYFSKLNTSSGESRQINKIKLLAMLIYKNNYPNDFEKLHKNEGAFRGIVSSKKELIDQKRKEIDLELTKLKEQLSNALKEEMKNEQELIEVYIGKVISKISNTITSIEVGNKTFEIKEINNLEIIKKIVKSDELIITIFRKNNQYNDLYNTYRSQYNAFDLFNEKEREIEKRISNIKIKSHKHQEEIKEKQKEKEKLTLKTLKEVISNEIIKEKCTEHSITEYQLLQYLIGFNRTHTII